MNEFPRSLKPVERGAAGLSGCLQSGSKDPLSGLMTPNTGPGWGTPHPLSSASTQDCTMPRRWRWPFELHWGRSSRCIESDIGVSIAASSRDTQYLLREPHGPLQDNLLQVAGAPIFIAEEITPVPRRSFSGSGRNGLSAFAAIAGATCRKRRPLRGVRR